MRRNEWINEIGTKFVRKGTVLVMGKYVRQLRFVIGGWEWSICFKESFFVGVLSMR
jgi:hypothetical protein